MTATVMSPTLMTATKMTGHAILYVYMYSSSKSLASNSQSVEKTGRDVQNLKHWLIEVSVFGVESLKVISVETVKMLPGNFSFCFTKSTMSMLY